MCPSDSALTDAEPFDSSASLPAREVLSDLEGHFERLVVVESRVDEGLVATPQTFVIDLRGPAHDLGDVVTGELDVQAAGERDRKSTRLNSSHVAISYAVSCLKKKRQPTLLPLLRLHAPVLPNPIPDTRLLI